jgi:glycosyltransferase involved in cell wall biosynthesis
MLGHHNTRGTWKTKVDGYIALTEFMRRKLIEGGLPADRVFVKSNFVHPDPGPKEGQGEFALFVGRFVPEKGVLTVVEAWRRMGGEIPLRIAGSGPLADRVSKAAAPIGSVKLLGWQPRTKVLELMQQARFLVFASSWYEGFPMVLAEAFACSLPVVAAGVGSAAEIVSDGLTGRLFEPDDAQDLADKVRWAWDHPHECLAMGGESRRQYEGRYTAPANYRRLVDIYQNVIAGRLGGG